MDDKYQSEEEVGALEGLTIILQKRAIRRFEVLCGAVAPLFVLEPQAVSGFS